MPNVNDLPKKRRDSFENNTFNTDYRKIAKRAMKNELKGQEETSLPESNEVEIWDHGSYYDWVVDDDITQFSDHDFFDFQNASDFGFDFFDDES